MFDVHNLYMDIEATHYRKHEMCLNRTKKTANIYMFYTAMCRLITMTINNN